MWTTQYWPLAYWTVEHWPKVGTVTVYCPPLATADLDPARATEATGE